MTPTQIVTVILLMMSGVGIFLTACNMLSDALARLGNRRLKILLGKSGGNKAVGAAVGATATAVIQSSSATTVMVIGFVNAGVMTLETAATIIFGANVGTTVTGLLVAFGITGGGGMTVSTVLSAFVCVGAFTVTFAKSDKAKKMGGASVGFGLMFVGIDIMSTAMGAVAEQNAIKSFLASFEAPILLVTVGALITAVIQSSSVMTSMAIAMTVSGLISLGQGIYITIGSNIGTCVTTLLAGLAGSTDAKRAAVIHLVFNVVGAAVFSAIGAVMRICGTDYGAILGKAFGNAPQIGLAVFHALFNIVTLLIMLPLTRRTVRLASRIVRDGASASKKKTEQNKSPY